MKWQELQEKILLILRIKNHEKGTLCRDVYEECKSNGWPGLGQEVSSICDELGIPDVNNVVVSKKEIKEAVLKHHYSDMVNIVQHQTKLEEIKDDDFHEVQDYFQDKSVKRARMAFKIRSHMVPKIPSNF